MSLDVLMTGHKGFIGRHLGAALSSAGLSWKGVSKSEGVDLEKGNALAGQPAARWIVHLAAKVGVVPSWTDPEAFYRTNVMGTLAALEYARTSKASVLYLSSYMYGIPRYMPIDEKHPVSCLNPYAQSKHMGEALCESYAGNYSVPCVVLRPFSVYGMGQTEDQLVPHIIAQAIDSAKISLADLKPIRDFLWVGDLVRGVLSILKSKQEGYKVYNIGTGEGVSVGDVAGAVLAQTGPREVICQDKERRNEIPVCIADPTAIKRDFGWQPTTTLAEGIRQMIEAKRAG